jgi:hypothetical protein
MTDTYAFFVPAPDGTPLQVEVLDVYQPFCTVQAISGEPFVAGLLWPMRTKYAVVRCTSVQVVPGPVEVETPTGLPTILTNVDNASFPINK